MQLCPLRDQSPDARWQGAIEDRAFFDRNDCAPLVVSHVEMGRVVLVEIHADDDAEESTYFGHGIKKTGKLRQWKDERRRARRVVKRGRLGAVMFNFEF